MQWRLMLHAVAVTFATSLQWPAIAAEPSHAISMHGQPAHGPGFAQFGYVNPNAPKGGRISIGIKGAFDSLNPFIIKGVAARGLRDSIFGNNVYESLMARGYGEPFSLYGLLAKTITVPDDRSWVAFHLDERAKFSDGRPVTVDDVIFSLETLRDHGRNNHRTYYKKITGIKRLGNNGVRMDFADGSDRELPLILGLMPILPKHRMDGGRFEKTSLKPPIGSGPYRVAAVDPGASILLRRNPDYWAKDLPAKRGFDNFDEIKIEYYREYNSLFEAFKKGLLDFFLENSPGRWSTGYDFPAMADGRIVKEKIKTGIPKGMFAFVFNTRREIFKDIRVRRALIHLFDFEWINKSLYHGLCRRTNSFFEGSELSSIGRPATEGERILLGSYAKVLNDDVLAGSHLSPTSNGSGRDRKMLRKALKLMAEAGWRISGGALLHTRTKSAFEFELLVNSGEHERVALLYQRTLRLLGISMQIRRVDAAQYQGRLRSYDYDMIPFTWYSSLSPGNEQTFRWSVASAGQQGTFNIAGARNPVLDGMIGALLAARGRDEFVTAVRALDRVLITGAYGVPMFHIPEQWVARWKRVQRPDKSSLYGVKIQTWWANRK